MPSRRPQLSNAAVPLTHAVEILDERGRASTIHIPAERPLTVYVDKRELVTLMTLGGAPEALTLGYLRNQRLVKSLDEVESVQVDWAVEAVAVKTRNGIANVEERTAKRVVTTGCGQGSVFGGLMDEVDSITLDPDARLQQSTLYRIVDTIRTLQSIYKQAGSVHGCALFSEEGELIHFVEDVGRHNAVDKVVGALVRAGRIGSGAASGGPAVLAVSGRTGFEIVQKAAAAGIPAVASISAPTSLAVDLARAAGIALAGFVRGGSMNVYAHPERLAPDPSHGA